MSKKKIAVCFPGQGTQYVGMGRDLLEGYRKAQEVFRICEEVVGSRIRDIMLNGPLGELTRTEILQPALSALEISLYLALRDEGVAPHACAGHSLGEYPALFAAGVVEMPDIFHLVSRRGALMEEATRKYPGAMAAVIGLDRETISQVIGPVAHKGTLTLANYNAPEQIIITGEKALVAEASKALKLKGARVVPLKVAGAYHSPLMTEAASRFREELEQVNFKTPSIVFYSNVTGIPEKEPKVIEGLMVEQITSPVLWYPIVKNMYDNGIRIFIEVGPKKVLTNLTKKCLSGTDAILLQFEDMEGVMDVLKALKEV